MSFSRSRFYDFTVDMWRFIFSIAIIISPILPLQSHAKVEFDSSCPARVMMYDYLDAVLMGVSAASMLSADPRVLRDTTPGGLWGVLFDDVDLERVIGTFNNLGFLFSSTSTTITFYCNENNIHWRGGDKSSDSNGYFYDSGFKDKNGAPQNQIIPYYAGTPHQTACERGHSAYTNNGVGDLSNQVHIFICNRALQPEPLFDQRKIKDIKDKGLIPGFSYIDSVRPLSLTILHELFHSRPVGGMDSQGPIILDGPTGNSYGFYQCRKLKLQNSRAPVINADSYAILALGLYLQFPEWYRGFTWATGLVTVGGNNHGMPYIPPAELWNID